MPPVLIRTQADKSFISSIAKKAISEVVQSCPCFEMCDVLIDGSKSKALALAEYSVA